MPPVNPRRAIEAIVRTQLHCYSDPARVQADAEQLLSNIVSLTPKVGTLTHNNGTQSTLMVLAGTVPIRYGGNQYNIPVEVFVPEAYPNQPPVMYVRPTAAMMIKQGHRHVDAEGLVYLPYLNQWRPRTSNLLELCNAAAAVFSSEPPVFARPRNAPLVQPAVQQPIAAQPTPVVAQAAYATGAYSYQTAEAIVAQPPAAAASSKSPHQQLLDNVTMKLQEELVKLDSGIRHDIELEVESQAKLQQAQSTISAELAALRMTKERLLKALDALPQQKEALHKWHEEATQAEATESVDDLIVPFDIPSRQLIEAMADYHAIEDTLYYLDRAIAAGTPNLNLDSFLRETRRLAGKQFLAKCLVTKIEHACS